jgi:hypothetical protein
MKIKAQENKKALALRMKGYSFREISEILNISKSTASLWTRDIKLSRKASKRIEWLSVNGRKKAADTNWQKQVIEDEEILGKVKNYFADKNFSGLDLRVACALLYWCEGSKSNKMTFTNSDPEMIKFYLIALRSTFAIDEKKFRVVVHLHSYHDIKKQLLFWSRVTAIPLTQFTKPFLKKNTGINKKPGYQGCVGIVYYNNRIKKELTYVYEYLLAKMRA